MGLVSTANAFATQGTLTLTARHLLVVSRAIGVLGQPTSLEPSRVHATVRATACAFQTLAASARLSGKARHARNHVSHFVLWISTVQMAVVVIMAHAWIVRLASQASIVAQSRFQAK